jgi:hypothetical protein
MHMNGLFTTEEAHQLLEFPDLDRANKLKNSHIELLDKQIESIIDKNKYEPPEQYLNLELGIQRFQQAYNLAKLEGVPEERLEKLRRWIAKAAVLLEPTPQPQPAGMGMPPGAMPPEAAGGLPPMGPPMGPPGAMPPGPPMAAPPGAPAGLPPMPPGPPAIG